VSTRPIAIVLPPEFDGATGYIDDVGGGHEFTATSATPGAHAVAGVELAIGAACPPEQSYAYTYLKITKDGYRPYRQDAVRVFLGPVQIRVGVQEDPARTAMGLQDTFLPALTPNVQQARYPLKGRVYVQGAQWYDATGPVHLFFHHDMPLLRLLDEDPAEASRGLDAIASIGSGVRFMVRVSHDNNVPPDPGDYWYGRSVSEEMRRAHLITALDMIAARGLKACLTMGSRFPNDKAETSMWLETADMIVAAKHSETIAIAEHRNEPNMTSQYHWEDRAQAWALAKSTMQEFKRRVGCIITGGSWGDNDQVVPASDGMDALDMHEERSMADCIHHIHSAWNDAVFHQGYRKQIWGGERPGPNHPYPENTNTHPNASLGGDMYVGNDDPELQWGVVSTAHAHGQGTAWLTGPGVRRRVPLDSTSRWGVVERLLHQYIWADTGSWRGTNASWRTSGDPTDKRVLFAVLRVGEPHSATNWEHMLQAPPFPLAAWTAIGPDGPTDSGTGAPYGKIKGNWKFRLIVGTRA
jgi:hypothetical protein